MGSLTATMGIESDDAWSQAVKSLICMGSELLTRAQLDDAITIFDAAHSIISYPASPKTWETAANSLHLGNKLLEDTLSSVPKRNCVNSRKCIGHAAPDLYQEDECDVGPRKMETPVSISAGIQSPDTLVLLELVVLYNKALIYHAKGNIAEAKQVYEVVTFTVQNMLTYLHGAPSKDFAEIAMRSHNNLGVLNYLERNQSISAACFEASVQFARHLIPLGKSYHLEYAVALSNWCRVNWMYGDINEKLYQALKEVLHTRSTLLRWDHPDVAASRYNIAVAEYARQNSKNAIAQLNKYLVVASNRAKGKTGMDLDAIPALIFLLLIQNEDKEDVASQELVRGLRTLHDKRQDMGPNNLEVASVLNFIGTLLFHKEEFDNALVFFKEELRLEEDNECLSLDISRRSIDETSSVSVTCNNIGRILQELGRYDEAITFYRRALESGNYEASDVKLSSGKDNTTSCASIAARASMYKSSSANLYSTVWYNLGLIHDKLGAFNEAITAFEMSLELRKVLLGKNHPDIACLLYNIGVLQMEQQCLDGATGSFREALRIRRAGTAGQLSDRHIVKTLEKLASLHKAKGNIDGALEAFNEVRSIQEASVEYDVVTRFKELGVTLRSLAELYHMASSLEDAISMAMESVQQLRVSYEYIFTTIQANPNHEKDQNTALDCICSTEQLVTSLLLLGSLYHECCEPLQAETVLQNATYIVHRVTALMLQYPQLVTPSLYALQEVTSMLGICFCAAQA